MATKESFLRRAQAFQARYQGAEGLFWIKRVNHPAGAIIALLLLPTSVTPNAVTVAGFMVHVLAAVMLVLLEPPLSLFAVVAVLFLWQLAFTLDCTDGQLARARGTAGPFGAWLDQIVDVASHVVLYAALTVVVVRGAELDGVAAGLFGCLTISASLLQVFSTWQRAAVIGSGPPVGIAPPLSLRVLYALRHMMDFGAFLFVAGLLLIWAPGLMAFLLMMAALQTGYAGMQVVLAWRRASRAAGEGDRI
jgi:phosphatidylglycerophosphate synthase